MLKVWLVSFLVYLCPMKTTNYKKVKTLQDIQNDPRVSDVYKDKSTGDVVWWMYLSEGLISEWDGAGTITSDDNMKYLKDTLNSGAVITEEEYWKDNN